MQVGGLHAIVPKTNCPHTHNETLLSVNIPTARDIVSGSCNHCEETYENWVCLTCGALECSRYKNGHMKDHNEATSHSFALSLADFSCWCYHCNDYISSPIIKRVHDTLYIAKFNEPPPQYTDEPVVLHNKICELSDHIKRSRKVVFFTSNGINMSGIVPDENIPQLDANSDNSLFSIPSAGVPIKEIQPTVAHKVLKSLCEIPNTSHMVVSTNLDDLHKKTGMSSERLLQVKVPLHEDVPKNVLEEIAEKAAGADMYIVIGSSMRNSPSDKIPGLAKLNSGKLVIINHQNTPFDNESSLRIWASIDTVMEQLASQLGLSLC